MENKHIHISKYFKYSILAFLSAQPVKRKPVLAADYCPLLSSRYEDPGDAPARHAAHAGERPSAVLLRLLHLRYRGHAVVGGHA